MTIKASVAPIKNRIAKSVNLSEENEKTKHDIQFRNNIKEHILLGLNLVNIKPTKILEKESPKYTKDPIKACSE